MAIGDITFDNVRAAISECNEVGELTFVERYGFKSARRFLLEYRGRYYPSKAILGVAHRFTSEARALTSNELNGGDQHFYGAARVLRNLGFTVVDQPVDDWALWPQLDGAALTLTDRFVGWERWVDRDPDLSEGEYDQCAWPGVYVIGIFDDEPPKRVFPLPIEVIYIGQTTRTLRERLLEFHKSANEGRSGHSGGYRFYTEHNGALASTWVTMLPVRLPPSEQPGAITVLEGLLIWSYSRTWKRPPCCNMK